MRQEPARAKLLTRLLQAHERSVLFGRSAPWPREVILKFDARTWPEAFAPDGREERRLLISAARDLQSDGCLRIVYHHRGPLSGEPKEIRLGSENVDRAYQEGQRLGFEPLSLGLGEVAQHATELAGDACPPWMVAFLQKLACDARRADLSAIGMQRERFKREWRALVPALTAAAGLSRGINPAWERLVSERLLHDSKALSRVRPHVIAILVRADPRWEGVPLEEAADLLEAYGVRRKPGLIRCAGVATLRIGPNLYRLQDFIPVAHLPEAWADAWLDAVTEAGVEMVTTVENEYPFLSYVEEASGPANIGTRGELLVYTAGFPTPGLVNILTRLSERKSGVSFRHWGDADVGGIRIWWFLRQRLRRPIDFFRTTPEWVAAESARGGRPLSPLERSALRRLRTELRDLEGADIATARKVIDVLLEYGVKLEQERF